MTTYHDRMIACQIKLQLLNVKPFGGIRRLECCKRNFIVKFLIAFPFRGANAIQERCHLQNQIWVSVPYVRQPASKKIGLLGLRRSITLLQLRRKNEQRACVFINELSAAVSHFSKRHINTSVSQRSNFNTVRFNRPVGKHLRWKRKHRQQKGLRSSRDKAKGPAPTPELALTEPTKTLFYSNIKNI